MKKQRRKINLVGKKNVFEPAFYQDHLLALLLGSTEAMDPMTERKNGRLSERAVAKAAMSFKKRLKLMNTLFHA